MDGIVLRARVTKDRQLELLDDLPDDLAEDQEFLITLSSRSTVYQTVNDYGDPVLVDEEDGSISPLEPFTMGDLLESPIIGMWADREDMQDSVAWLKKMREEEQERNDPWRGRTLS